MSAHQSEQRASRMTDQQQTFSSRDLCTGARLTEVVAAGEQVVFGQKTISSDGKSSATNLFLHNASTMACTQVTRQQCGSCYNPVLGVDLPGCKDSLLYLKSSDQQVWALPMAGGESFKLTDLPIPVESFKIFRGSGTKIWMLCVMSVFPGMSPDETVGKDKALEGESSGMVFDQLMVRHWDQWGCYKKRNHLFLCQMGVNHEGLLKTSGNVYDLMFDWESDCPCKVYVL